MHIEVEWRGGLRRAFMGLAWVATAMSADLSISGCSGTKPKAQSSTSEVAGIAAAHAGHAAAAGTYGAAGHTAGSATSSSVPPQPATSGSDAAGNRADPRSGAAGTPSDNDGGAPQPPDDAPDPALGELVLSPTRPLAVIAGRYGPDRSGIQLYSADLGWTFKHEDRLWVLFGDSWVNPLVQTIDTSTGQDANDAIGHISLTSFPDGDAVSKFIEANPGPTGSFTWQAAPPTLDLVINPMTRVATPVRQVRDGKALSSGNGLTPLTGFSNLRHDDTLGAFGIFFRNAPLECSDHACPGGLTCDAGLGLCVKRGQQRTDLSLACVLGSPATDSCEECQPLPNAGLCIDTGTSLYDTTNRGRTASVAIVQEVGNAVRGQDNNFATQGWVTQRFFGLTARAVRDFDPQRARGAGNNYRSADGEHPEREGVFLWGRPRFGGVQSQGRDAQLYLAWVAMPSYAPDGHFDWKPRFFAGTDAQGRPRFVEREVDSVPLDLDASMRGVQPDEPIDVVGHMTVAYLPSLQRWIMLYGGALWDLYAGLVFGDDVPYINKDTVGPIYVRYAAQPWGPWTKPQRFMYPGDAATLTGMYEPGGPLRSTACASPQCVMSEITLTSENGWVYAPNIIEPWLEERQHGVDLYWLVSSWNPYATLLMQTSLLVPDTQ